MLWMLAYLSTYAHVSFRFTSFSVPSPLQTAQYMKKYLGGVLLRDENMPSLNALSPTADMAGLRYYYARGAAFLDILFWFDYAAGNASDALKFSSALERSFARSPDDWNWWQDWHICFNTDDIDAVALRLMKDRIPFSNAAYGLYFMLPGGVTMQLIGRPTLYWGEDFYFCRKTTEAGFHHSQYYTLNTTDIDSLPNRPYPVLIPVHHAFATAHPDAAFAWTQQLLDMQEMTVHPIEGFQYSDGQCAYVKWLTIPDYWFQVHYVEQKFKRDGGVNIRSHEAAVVRTLSSSTWPNAFSGTRLGFSVTSFEAFMRHLSPSFTIVEESDKHLVVVAPFGYLFHVFEDATFQREALTRLYPPSFQSPHLVAQPGGFFQKKQNTDLLEGHLVLVVVAAFAIGSFFSGKTPVARLCL